MCASAVHYLMINCVIGQLIQQAEFCDVVHLAGVRLCRQTALAAAASAGTAEMDPSSRFGVNEFSVSLSFSIFWIWVLRTWAPSNVRLSSLLLLLLLLQCQHKSVGNRRGQLSLSFGVYMCCSVVVHQWNLSLASYSYCCAQLAGRVVRQTLKLITFTRSLTLSPFLIENLL